MHGPRLARAATWAGSLARGDREALWAARIDGGVLGREAPARGGPRRQTCRQGRSVARHASAAGCAWAVDRSDRGGGAAQQADGATLATPTRVAYRSTSRADGRELHIQGKARVAVLELPRRGRDRASDAAFADGSS